MALLGPPPQDETQHHNPHFGPLHENNVHWFFMESPYYDPAANNSLVLNEAQRFAEKYHLLQNRKAFEAAVQAVPSGGLQFIIVDEPRVRDAPWVMQKQQRTVRRGQPDEIEILGTWWILKDHIIPAANMADILQSRFQSITVALNDFFEMANELVSYSPSTGHTYGVQASNKPKQASQAAGSRAESPEPMAEDSSQIPPSSQPITTGASSTTKDDSAFPDAFFFRSLNLTMQYEDDYMDENPLLGEPGNFVFKRDGQSQATVADSASTGLAGTQPKSVDGEGVSTAAPTPQRSFDASGQNSRKGSVAKVPKSREGRRKSKAGASPISPTAPPG